MIKNSLIKVEESTVFEGKEIHADWYYVDGKSLYYTFNKNQEKSIQRAELLLSMGKQLLTLHQEGFTKQKP